MKASHNPAEPSFHAAWPWLVASFLLLCFAIAFSTFRMSQDAYRFLFVVDITQSMNVRDMASGSDESTRLEFAKSVLETSLKNLPCGTEAGLAIFTAHRTFVMFTPVEICEHYQALSSMLTKLDWRMAWTARSEVAKGLYSAIDAVRQIEPETHLVFLTDGHEAPPLNRDIRPPFAAEPGSVAGFIGGIGGSVPGRIPHIDADDNIVGYWSHDEVMQIDIHSLGRGATEQSEQMVGIDMVNIARRIALGQEHLSSLRENHLRELAMQTGLDYVHVDSPSTFVQSLLKDKYARPAPVLTDMGWIPATLAIVCLIYCFVLLPWRNRPASAVPRSADFL